MPRNAAGVFTLDSRYLVDEGDTILPSQHNPVLEDIQTDLNAARPIVAGGTGATSAVSARQNLSVYSKADTDSGFTEKVATTTALKALDTALHKVAFVLDKGKLFTWETGDFTDEAAADTEEEFYIPSTGIAVSLGIWRAASGSTAEIAKVGDIADDLAIVAPIADDVTTVAGIAANVTTVAGVSTDIPTVAADSTKIATVAGISADISTVAAIPAGDVSTVAGKSADIGTVAGISTDVSAVAGVSTDVTTVAGNIVAVQNASANADAAAASATAAATSETNAAQSETDAAADAAAAEQAKLDTFAAVPNSFPTTRTALAALTGSATNAYLLEAGYQGQFSEVAKAGYTDLIAADTVGGEIKVSTADTSKAWLRIRKNGDLFKTSECGDDVAVAVAVAALRGNAVEINKPGTILLSAGLLIPAAVNTLIGLGSDKTVLKPDASAWTVIGDFVTKSYAGGAGWAMFFDDANSGTRTELPSFTTVGVKETSILFDSDPSLSPGDEIEIENTADWSLDGYRSVDRAGERNVVVAMEGNRAHLLYEFQDTYAYATTLKAWKVHAPLRRAGGFTLDLTDAPDTASAWGAVKFFRSHGGEIDDLRVVGAKYEGIEFDQCLGLTPARLRSYTRVDSAFSGFDYALMITNSRDVKVHRSEGAGNWAGSDFGGWDVSGDTPNDDCGYFESKITGHMTSPAASMHPNTRRCGYHDCDIENGMMQSGIDPHGTDCRINNRRGSCAIGIYGSELTHGTVTLDGTQVVSALNAGATVNNGCVLIHAEASRNGGGQDTISGADGQLFISWKGGRLYAPAETRPFYFEEISNDAPISVDIDIEVQVDSVDTDGLIRILKTGTTAEANYFRLRVQNYTQTQPYASWNGGYSAAERVFPRQRGIWSATSTAVNTMDLNITLPHAYPSIYDMGGNATLLTNALGPKVHADIRSLTNTDIRPFIATGDDANMTAGTAFKVAWEAY